MTRLWLRLASWWLPPSILRSELENVASRTTAALSEELRRNAPGEFMRVSRDIKPLSGSIDERRAVMASNHNALVKALVDEIGKDKAVEVGRAALFKVGQGLGEEARTRFSVGDSLEDLILAARVMYKVLGIEFNVRGGGEELTIEIDRCALSKGYSELTCMVTSAADEGVVRGLNPSVSMRFETRITSGCPTCVARIKIDPGEPE